MSEPASHVDPRLHPHTRAAAGDLWLTVARSGTVIEQIAYRGHANRSYEVYIAATRPAKREARDLPDTHDLGETR